jgi:hypothetical protein
MLRCGWRGDQGKKADQAKPWCAKRLHQETGDLADEIFHFRDMSCVCAAFLGEWAIDSFH